MLHKGAILWCETKVASVRVFKRFATHASLFRWRSASSVPQVIRFNSRLALRKYKMALLSMPPDNAKTH